MQQRHELFCSPKEQGVRPFVDYRWDDAVDDDLPALAATRAVNGGLLSGLSPAGFEAGCLRRAVFGEFVAGGTCTSVFTAGLCFSGFSSQDQIFVQQ